MNNDWKKKENTRHAAERPPGRQGRRRAHENTASLHAQAGRDGLKGKHTDGERGAATTQGCDSPARVQSSQSN